MHPQKLLGSLTHLANSLMDMALVFDAMMLGNLVSI